MLDPGMHWQADAPNAAPEPVAADPRGAPTPGPGWHPDPFDPARRLRWWDGDTWTSRVVTLEVGSEAISWHAHLDDHGPPGSLTTPLASPAAKPEMVAVVDTSTPVPRITHIAEPTEERSSTFSWRRVAAVAAVAAVLVATTAVVSGALLGGDTRPALAPSVTYRDATAGLSLRYPEAWHLDKKTPGQGVRFLVGAKNALPSDANTVSVTIGAALGQTLPPLHLLANEATQRFIEKLPNIRLDEAARTRLAQAPAYRVVLEDTGASPPTHILEWIGLTTSRQTLTVVVTIREPRNAPSDRDLARFLHSITSR